MHIKELVLDNFKSFGRKTRIPFYADFTTISGPNGSGKSNIIDGVLFALGLARTRGIRARKLTDLIYNPGHESEDHDGHRDGPAEASVTVVLDNTDRTLSRGDVVAAAGTEDVGDVDEITVKRRVKETEANYYSYYYLNGRSVNLSDIREVLATAGVTPEGYNVVMQGDVTDIISMSATDRRKIVDEIAGVARFDEKREDAFEELETVRDQIAEAQLRIDEKRDRLDRLEDERETALEYRELRDRKTEYESYRKASELEDKRAELDGVETRIADLEDQLADRRRELDEREGRVVRLEEDLADVDDEIQRKGEDEQLRIKSEIEEVKGDISRLEDRIAASEDAIDDAEADRREAFVSIDRKKETIEDLQTEIREIKLEAASVKSDVKDRRGELAEVEEQIAAADAEYDELRAELQERKQALETAKAERNDRQREKDRLLDDSRRRAEEIAEIEETIADQREQIPQVEAEIDDAESELQKARANREQIASVVEDLKEEKRSIQADLGSVEDDLQAKQAEYAELKANASENGDSSFGRAVSTVLNADVDGVHGAVAQLGSVAGEYARACETAAGGRMANVVVDDDGVGQRCIDFLKSHNAGRATFLPLSEMEDRRLPSPPAHTDVIDFAYNLVEFDDRYSGVFSYVLGDTLVVEDVDTAREFMGRFRLVTLDGDLVEKTGAMTGGSGGGSRYSFSQSGAGRLERVGREIQDLEDRRREIRDRLSDVEGRLDDARDRKTEATERVNELESTLERHREKRRTVEREIAEYERRVQDLRERREALDEQMAEADGAIEEQTEEITAIETDVQELEAELADSEIPELAERKERLRSEIDDLEDRVDDLQAERNELELEKRYAEEAIEDLDEDVEDARSRKEEHERKIERFEEQIEEKEDTLDEKRKQILALEEEIGELKAEREAIEEDLTRARERRDEKAREVERRESERDDERDRRDRLAGEIADLEDEVGGYDPDDVPSHHEVVSEIGRLEAEMEELEPVNMLAIDEYEEVRSELDELLEGKTTLEAEREEIRDRIDSYEAQKREAFTDAYECINEHFQRIFSRLSNGTGSLHLENEDDPFEGGLTMKAQPEDKPIQRLAAMSGGEKSLTALAFIFAIQRHSPAPFYALDEIDAFLDAANADRVGELVDELAGQAQFVVVSHRSAMLDRSERAIGVTMGDDNVSAVTGIRLGGREADTDADAEGENEDEEVAADD
jgi:chromosome segregation protein